MPRPIKNVRKHGRRHVFRAMINGQWIVEDLGEDESEARRQAKLLREDIKRRRAQRPKVKPSGTVQEFAEEWWLPLYVPENRKERDHKMIRARMEQHILPVLGKLQLDAVRRCHLEELSQSLKAKTTARDKKLSVNTRRHILSDARCMFNYAVEMEKIPASPFAGKRVLPPSPRVAPTPLTDEELELVRSVCEDPYRSAIDLAVSTGMRWGEQRNLQWRHVHMEDAEPTLVIDRAKGNKWRRIPLDGTAVKILSRWREESSSVFVMPWRPPQAEWPPRLSHRLTGVKWHWHMLRHTFACRYLRDGGSIEVLSKLLGHSSVKTTERYAAVFETTVKAEFWRVRGADFGQKLATTG